MTTTTSISWPRRLTLAGLLAWGLLHIAGGLSLLASDTSDALDTLAPDATTPTPVEPGDAIDAVLRFHALNIVLGGLAVTALAALWHHRRARWTRDTALGIAAALDIGLIAFLVLPGLLPASQGLLGPLLVAAITGLVVIDRHRPALTT